MSADGEVEVAVRAEGTEDAAEQLAEGAEAGGGQQAGGLRGRIGRAGLLGGALLALAGPLLDVLTPILSLLEAFLAPVAIMLLRLLSPVLRILFSRVLPAWLSFMSNVNGWISKLSFLDKLSLLAPTLGLLRLLGIDVRGLWETAKSLPSDIWSFMKRLPRQIWEFVRQLPSRIASAIRPDFASPPSRSTGEFGFNGASDAQSGSGIGSSNPIINFSGGLSTLIDRIESSADVDLQP